MRFKTAHFLRFGLVMSALSFATAATANCPQGQEEFTSCQIEGRNTEVRICFDTQVATYSYGPIAGKPDLFLSQSIATVDYEPWSGLGTAISETITFYNSDYGYFVGGGFERPFSEDEMEHPIQRFGWVEVTQSGVMAAYLECVPDTVTFGFGGGIHDVKVAAGTTWHWDSRTWISKPFHSVATPILSKSRRYGAEFDCLPMSEFSLNGIPMGETAGALAKLGTPVSTDDTTFSDEPIDRITLDGLNIDFFRDVMVTMSAKTPAWQMPSGLRVGLTRGEVIQLLGRVPDGYSPTSSSFTINTCSKTDDDTVGRNWFALIEFGQDKRVKELTFVTASE